MTIELVLVDIDNTLVDTSKANENAMEFALRDKYSIDFKEYKQLIRFAQKSRPFDLTVEHPLQHIAFCLDFSGKNTNLLDLSDCYNLYLDRFKNLLKPNIGVEEFLRKTKAANKKIHAVTNNSIEQALIRLTTTGIAQFIDKIITPEWFGYGKSNPMLFQNIIQFEEIAASKIVMIGDNIVTDGACSKLGIKFFHYNMDSDFFSKIYLEIF